MMGSQRYVGDGANGAWRSFRDSSSSSNRRTNYRSFRSRRSGSSRQSFPYQEQTHSKHFTFSQTAPVAASFAEGPYNTGRLPSYAQNLSSRPNRQANYHQEDHRQAEQQRQRIEQMSIASTSSMTHEDERFDEEDGARKKHKSVGQDEGDFFVDGRLKIRQDRDIADDCKDMIEVEISKRFIRRDSASEETSQMHLEEDYPFPKDWFKHRDLNNELVVLYSDNTIRSLNGYQMELDVDSMMRDTDKITRDQGCKEEKLNYERFCRQNQNDMATQVTQPSLLLNTTRKCIPSSQKKLEEDKRCILKHKDDYYSVVFYSICIEKDKMSDVDIHGLSQNPIRKNGRIDKKSEFEKFCVPNGIKGNDEISLSERIKHVAQNSGDLFPDLESNLGGYRPDPNFNRYFALTHVMFMPLSYFKSIKASRSIPPSYCSPFCSSIMRGERHDCLVFDLETDLDFLTEVSKLI